MVLFMFIVLIARVFEVCSHQVNNQSRSEDVWRCQEEFHVWLVGGPYNGK